MSYGEDVLKSIEFQLERINQHVIAGYEEGIDTLNKKISELQSDLIKANLTKELYEDTLLKIYQDKSPPWDSLNTKGEAEKVLRFCNRGGIPSGGNSGADENKDEKDK